jgi:hypothetical protein
MAIGHTEHFGDLYIRLVRLHLLSGEDAQFPGRQLRVTVVRVGTELGLVRGAKLGRGGR